MHITPRTLDDFRTLIARAQVHSFWGHTNTLLIASAIVGVNLAPDGPPGSRPTLVLSDNLLPMLNGVEFTDCWVLSPNYKENFRPAVGQAVASEQIADWQVLYLTWP